MGEVIASAFVFATLFAASCVFAVGLALVWVGMVVTEKVANRKELTK